MENKVILLEKEQDDKRFIWRQLLEDELDIYLISIQQKIIIMTTAPEVAHWRRVWIFLREAG